MRPSTIRELTKPLYAEICGEMRRFVEMCGDMRRYAEICGELTKPLSAACAFHAST